MLDEGCGVKMRLVYHSHSGASFLLLQNASKALGQTDPLFKEPKHIVFITEYNEVERTFER